jgi:hypothetical protein
MVLIKLEQWMCTPSVSMNKGHTHFKKKIAWKNEQQYLAKASHSSSIIASIIKRDTQKRWRGS